MRLEIKTSQNVFWAIFFLYFAPIFILSIYSMDAFGKDPSWGVLSLGLLEAAAGSCLMYIFVRTDPVLPLETIKEPIIAENPLEETVQQLQKELLEYQDISEKFTAYRMAAEDEIRKKESILSETQETISRQRDVLKKRQDQVNELESKIQGLNVEVKSIKASVSRDADFSDSGTLIKETPAVYQVSAPQSIVESPKDAKAQLKKCLDIASKITGSNHFEAANSRFRDWHIDNYALDLRRLFDHLRSEMGCTIFVFSQKDNRLLFVNNQSKNLLGWAPEKFIQNFNEIIEEGSLEWNQSISKLAKDPETEAQFKMKNKLGQLVEIKCNMAMISSGLFKNHIIGILYSSSAMKSQ